jgi:magnesium transporter
MNFDPDTSPLNMPELRWFYGYPFAWGIMLAMAIVMFIYFRRKKWL